MSIAEMMRNACHFTLVSSASLLTMGDTFCISVVKVVMNPSFIIWVAFAKPRIMSRFVVLLVLRDTDRK